MKKQCSDEILNTKIIAILRDIDDENIDGVCSALIESGIKVIEYAIDHNTSGQINDTLGKIERTAAKYPQLHVGCGTVLDKHEARQAIDAGAQLIVSPGTNIEVIETAKRSNIVSIPGAMTATECINAYQAGADFIKIFPAGELGASYIKALMAPLKHIPMLAVAGITLDNIEEFLKLGVKGFGISSNIISPEAVKNKDYKAIKEKAAKYMQLISAFPQ